MADDPQHMTLPEAAGVLRLPIESVQALTGAGYLRPTAELADGPRFALGDLKAFLARNERTSDVGDGELILDRGASLDDLDPEALLDALDGRSEDMARRALDLLVAVFPEAGRWPLSQQAHFIEDARARFEAIVAVASLGSSVDESLIEELATVGADTAESGTPLTEVLLVLRISRDLVVQTAVEVADDWGRHWGLALSLVLTRVLPALDRLTDAIARGYWTAVIRRQDENQSRYENVVEHASDGVFEITPGGEIIYANAALGIQLGRSVAELLGQPLLTMLNPATDYRVGLELAQVATRRPDGVVRILEIRTVERHVDGVLVGYDGVVRDLTAALHAEQLRNDFLGLLGHELRQPLTTVLGLGATLEEHGDELGGARVQSVGERIRRQAERMTRLTDDLFEFSRLELGSLVLSPRRVLLRSVVEHALAGLGVDVDASGVVLDVPAGLAVVGEPRRLEQVFVNLVENGLRFGAPPVEVTASLAPGGRNVAVVVRDHGPGVDIALLPTLFSELRHLTRVPRRRSADGGLGLALVRGLVEAMGGRVSYETPTGGGAAFVVTLPAA